jgi:hypothetical protein
MSEKPYKHDEAHERLAAITKHLREEHSLSPDGCEAMKELVWIILNAYDGVVQLGPKRKNPYLPRKQGSKSR